MTTDNPPDAAARIEFGTRPNALPLEWAAFKSKQFKGFRVQYRRLTGPIEYQFSNSGDVHRFSLLDMYREDGETIVDGAQKITSKDLRDRFVYSGPGSTVTGWAKIERAMSFVLVEMAPDTADADFRVPSMFVQADALTRSILMQFKSLVLDEGAYSASYAETLATMLREETRRIGGLKSLTKNEGTGLTPRQLKTAISHMEDRIDQDISISDMAAHLGISPFHFIRMFKKSTGQPPHKYLLGRRIEKAKEMLHSPQLTISEVAERAGFGGVTQLERAFRRIVGATPSSFRRQLLQD